MTPIEQYEAQQRALETERYARLAKALEADAKQPANFCNAYDVWEPVPAWLLWSMTCLLWVLRIAFVLALTVLFWVLGMAVRA